MSESVNDYIARLDQQLRQRGIVDPRILAEAREHLIDAVDDARHRGLSLEDAEHEALERFGAPEIVAAHILEERDRMKTGLMGAFATLWQRKWWMLVPTMLAAVVTAAAAYYFLPNRYRAESKILVLAPRVSSEYATASVDADRFKEITNTLLSTTRLEAMITELDLYREDRKNGRVAQAIERMRRDIDVTILTPQLFSVSYVSPEPRTAVKVTEALVSLLIDSNVNRRVVEVQSTSDFIESQIQEVREQIIAQEKMLETLRRESGGRPLSQAYLIPYETLKETYKSLLVKQQQATLAANVERRQFGEQFRVLDLPRIPEQPDGPNRVGVTLLGTLVGLGLGLALVMLRRSSNAGPPTLAQA
jgi:uncharacterized protein involved in exopolysaccharide biosynthesis